MYRSDNANPVDRLVFDTPHAESLHGGPPPDRALWFADRAPTAPVFTAGASPIGSPIAAAVRCCVPPDADTAHDALCPVYGYPPPPAVEEDAPPSWAAAGLAAAVADPTDPEPTRSLMQASAVAHWAIAADRHTMATPDGYLWCRAFYSAEGWDGPVCQHPQDARFSLHMEGGSGTFAQLVVWVGLHADCWEDTR